MPTHPPSDSFFLHDWIPVCMGQDLRVRRADHDNSTFISRNDFSLHGVMGVSTLVFLLFETRGLAVLRFLSCAANVQGTHRLPVTSVPVLCFIVEKLINLFKLVVALIHAIHTHKCKRNTTFIISFS